MAGSDEPLLSELCRICMHVLLVPVISHIPNGKPVLTRAGARASSAAAAIQTRHKLWSQCSGERDPAAYLKRGELATPASIDRDFNFLVGIERRLDNGDRDVEERGIDLDFDLDHGGPPSRSRRRPLQKGEFNLAAAMDKCGVIIDKAPKGMQREKENKTHWLKKLKCLAWTVEWIDEHGQRNLDSVLETCSLQGAHERHVEGQFRAAQKRKRHGDEPRSSPAEDVAGAVPDLDDSKSGSRSALADHGGIQFEPHFYLLRPHTPAGKRVLIPLSPTTPLSECLTGRVLLEYPTVYVLPQSPTSLPKGFVSEAQYLRRPDRDESRSKLLSSFGETNEVDDERGKGREGPSGEGGPIDETRMLQVLTEDLERPDLADPHRIDAG